MGVFRSEILYRTDAGKVLAVTEMATSHLMNAIAHHQKQVVVLEDILEEYEGDTGYIKARKANLEETIVILQEELIERNPDDDPERHPKTKQRFHDFDDEPSW